MRPWSIPPPHSLLSSLQVDRTYRNYLQVRNGGRVAMKLNVVNRADVCDYFEFSPDFGFAQVGSHILHTLFIFVNPPTCAPTPSEISLQIFL